MKSRALISILIIGAVSTTVVAAEIPEWCRYYQELHMSGKGITELRLQPEVVDKAQPDLRDIRICNSDGSEAPYILNSPRPEVGRFFPASAVDTQVTTSRTMVLVTTGTQDQIEAVLVETPARDFLKVVQVEGSSDQRAWHVIAKNRPIFRQPDGSNNLRVNILVGRWPYLRISIDDRVTTPIPVSTIQARSSPVEDLPVTRHGFEIGHQSEFRHESKLFLRLPFQNVYLAFIEIRTTDAVFRRKVRLSARSAVDGLIRESELGTGTVYRLSDSDLDEREDLTMKIHRQVKSHEVVLTVQNGDSPPLEIQEVYAHVVDPSVFFHAREDEPRYLLFGNKAAKKQEYDISSLKERSLQSRRFLAEAGPLLVNSDHVSLDPFSDIAVKGKAFNVQNWSYRKHVLIERSGVQRLDLDPEVLSRSDHSGRDLRLVEDSHQIPFLLDQAGVCLELLPEVERLESEQDSNSSWWALDLGQAHLPISHLTCSISETLFRRSVTLHEEIEDARGRKRKRRIGWATWIRSPQETETRLEVTATRRLLTRTLFLEVDNGDNPPLLLEGFRVYYRAPRLIFRADAGSPLWLYYGNKDAPRPRYDIGLIAPALFSADKAPATLETAENLEERSWWKTGEPKGVMRWFFWLCLGITVLVLLAVIARLLPAASNLRDRPEK